ncbi:hypothetical protein U1Q18_009453 [Sarracenia purpurea var. burkii]
MNVIRESIPVNEKKKSEINVVQKLVIPSSDNLKVKFSAMGSHKHGPPGSWDGQKEKRRTMDSVATQQCSIILKQLMTYPSGWDFNQPVYPVELNIPDYFSIVSEPMNLGTIKTKLEKSSVEDFAADVRLTLSNAMLYNPPAKKVHSMTKELNNIFDTRWNILEVKFNRKCTNGKPGHILSGSAGNIHNPEQNGHKISQVWISSLPKSQMSTEEKQKLKRQLLEVSRGKMPPHLQEVTTAVGALDALDDSPRLGSSGSACRDHQHTVAPACATTKNKPRPPLVILFDLCDSVEPSCSVRDLVCDSVEPPCSCSVRDLEAEPAKPTKNGEQQAKRKIICKGTNSGNRSGLGSANVNPPTSKCGLCDSIRCQCSLQSNYALASSSGVASHLDEELICSGPHLSTLAETVVSGRGCSSS